MNTVRSFATALVGIVTTCVLSAGAAAAQPVPYVPAVPQVSSPSPIGAQQSAAAQSAKNRAQLLLKQQAYIDHIQNAYAAKEAAEARSRAARVRGSHSGSLVAPAEQSAVSNASSQRSGNGSEVPVLAITALAGLALGAAGSTASRRIRRRPRLAA